MKQNLCKKNIIIKKIICDWGGGGVREKRKIGEIPDQKRGIGRVKLTGKDTKNQKKQKIFKGNSITTVQKNLR